MSNFDLLRIREETFVSEIYFEDIVESTNSKASQRLETVDDEPVQTPFLVLADQQTAGRGRGQNQWWSREGALTFSLVVDTTDLDIEQTCKISLTAGLSVCQALERFAGAADLALKWPNDVYLEEKKVCGVLIERPAHAQDYLIIGIGVNVNNSSQDAPEELKPIATSMFDILENELDLSAVLIETLKHIERNFSYVSRKDRSLLDQWQAYDMLRGRRVSIRVHSNVVTGICDGIDSTGSLLLKTDDGVQSIIAGVIELIE